MDDESRIINSDRAFTALSEFYTRLRITTLSPSQGEESGFEPR
jgi:hypothetical protein